MALYLKEVGMLIVYGTAGLMLAALLYAVVLMGCRNPRHSAWTRDFWVGNIYVPAIIGLMVVGGGCLIHALLSEDRGQVGVMDVALAVGVVAVGAVFLKLLRVKQHLADYAAAAGSGGVVSLPQYRAAQAKNHPPSEPPVKPTSGDRAA
jgi:hypothetical protein